MLMSPLPWSASASNAASVGSRGVTLPEPVSALTRARRVPLFSRRTFPDPVSARNSSISPPETSTLPEPVSATTSFAAAVWTLTLPEPTLQRRLSPLNSPRSQLPLPVSQTKEPSSPLAVTLPEPVSALISPRTFDTETSPLDESNRIFPSTSCPSRRPTRLRKVAFSRWRGTCTSTSAYSRTPWLLLTLTRWPSYSIEELKSPNSLPRIPASDPRPG